MRCSRRPTPSAKRSWGAASTSAATAFTVAAIIMREVAAALEDELEAA